MRDPLQERGNFKLYSDFRCGHAKFSPFAFDSRGGYLQIHIFAVLLKLNFGVPGQRLLCIIDNMVIIMNLCHILHVHDVLTKDIL